MMKLRALWVALAAGPILMSAPELPAQEVIDLSFPDGNRRTGDFFERLRAQTLLRHLAGRVTRCGLPRCR